MEFKLEGLDAPLELPEKYLTVQQWEDCLRHFVKGGKTEVDFGDLAILRQLTSVLVPDVDLGSLPMTKANFETLTGMYTHVGVLLAEAMGVGEEVVAENLAEGAEKAPAPKKKRGRPRKNS